MTPQEVYEALRAEIKALRDDLREWREEMNGRLRNCELDIARQKERQVVINSYRAPWYNGLANAVLAGIVGAALALITTLITRP